jgi:hypothetical protein
MRRLLCFEVLSTASPAATRAYIIGALTGQVQLQYSGEGDQQTPTLVGPLLVQPDPAWSRDDELGEEPPAGSRRVV